jgi:hypothetical protein
MLEADAGTQRSWHFRELKWALQALAIPATEQKQLFPNWVAIPDELALDFDHWESVVRGNYGAELSKDQADRLAEVGRKLSSMSRTGADFEPELWAESALSSSQHWVDVRLLAASALDAFGWSVESPPLDPSERGTNFIR